MAEPGREERPGGGFMEAEVVLLFQRVGVILDVVSVAMVNPGGGPDDGSYGIHVVSKHERKTST